MRGNNKKQPLDLPHCGLCGCEIGGVSQMKDIKTEKRTKGKLEVCLRCGRRNDETN